MRLVVLLLSLAAVTGMVLADDDIEVYLKDGQLRAPLIIRDVQGGFAGFTGHEYKIDTDNKWTVSQLVGKKSVVKLKGTLTKEKVEKLAEELARYDLVNLKNSGRGSVNQHIVAFEFGRITAAVTLPAGQPLPKPNDGEDASMPERFGGVLVSVTEILSGKR